MSAEIPKKLKILVSAYACSPYHGSEPGMGWSFVSCLARDHELWVITEKYEFEEELTRKLREEPELARNLHFYYVPRKHHELLRKIWPPSYYWFYRLWQKKAYNLALQLRRDVDFDLVHQLNMAGFREPGYLWKMMDLPFVWGPIGGLDNTPWRMLSAMGLRGGLFYAARNLINLFQQRYLRRPKMAAQRPDAALISATPSTRQAALALWGKDSTVICEVGAVMNLDKQSPAIRSANEPLRLVWSGLHIPRKALNLLLDTLPLLRERIDFRLEIIGEGGETEHWQMRAKQLKVDEYCTWHGWVPRDKALEIMQSGHVFCITSLYDLTATVTLEALSLGMPIISMDLFGFSEVVTPACGFKLQAESPSSVKRQLAEKIIYLYENEDERQRLSRGAVSRAAEFSWDKKIAQLNAIYAGLLERKK